MVSCAYSSRLASRSTSRRLRLALIRHCGVAFCKQSSRGALDGFSDASVDIIMKEDPRKRVSLLGPSTVEEVSLGDACMYVRGKIVHDDVLTVHKLV